MAWGQYRSITIDHTKCGTVDSTNFPVLFFGTYTYLKTTANGGKVEDTNGYDIAFFSDSALTTMLDFERVSWSATTGASEFWVEVPTLDVDADTVIYLAYGNTSISTDQQNKTGTWNSNFLGAYHFEGNSNDSTSNARNGTDANISYTTTNSKFNQCGSFNGTSSKITLASTGFPTGQNAITIIAWGRPDTTNGPASCLMSAGTVVSNQIVLIDRSTEATVFDEVYCTYPGGFAGTDNFPINTWKRVAFVQTGSGGKIYVGGTEYNNGSNTLNLAYGAVYIGYNDWVEWWSGLIDEAYFLNTALSSSWITADWNNQNSPSTFYTIGSEEGVGGTTPVSARVGIYC